LFAAGAAEISSERKTGKHLVCFSGSLPCDGREFTMRTTLLAGLAAIPLLAAMPAWAQSQMNEQDRNFVQQAAQSGQQEIAAGQLAEHRARSPAVREFGRWMVADHSLLDKMLKAHAEQTGIQVPPPAKSDTKLSQLQHNPHFDAAYISEQVMAHEQAVALFQAEEQRGQNEHLKSLAQLALPLLQAHLTEARELQSRALAHAPPGARISVPSGAAPASTTQNTGSTSQPPTVKQMNAQAAQKIEKEGK
jgi:putative membrane protein